MNFIEEIGVGQERAETRLSAQIDRPSSMLDTGIVSRIYVSKDAPTECDKTMTLLLF